MDDDPLTLRFVRDALSEAGYALTVTGDPEAVPDLIEEEEPHLLLLDLMLPGTNGIELMERVRGLAALPVIFLSAYGRDEIVARALAAGADDYIVKPFSPTELVARVQTVLRRRAADWDEPTEPFVLDELTVDYAARRVALADRSVELTDVEYRLLRELSLNAGRVVTHDRLLERVWAAGRSARSGPLRTAVKNLRRALGDDANNPTYIFNEPRVGYRLGEAEGGGEAS